MRMQRGDTIVEVLIAIVIIASVLGSAFISTRRSQITTQRNDERSVANKLLEQQVELLKLESVSEGSTIYDGATSPFCMFHNAPDVLVADASDPECIFNPPESGAEYQFVINKIPEADPELNTFSIEVVWDRLAGDEVGDRDSVIAYYRVYPE